MLNFNKIERSLGKNYNMYWAIYGDTALFIYNNTNFVEVEDISSSIMGGIITKGWVLKELFPNKNVDESIVGLASITVWVEIKNWLEFVAFIKRYLNRSIVIDQNGDYIKL